MSKQFSESSRNHIARMVQHDNRLLSIVALESKSKKLIREIYEVKKYNKDVLISLARNQATDNNILSQLPFECYYYIVRRKGAVSFNVQEKIIDECLRNVVSCSIKSNRENAEIILSAVSNKNVSDELKMRIVEELFENEVIWAHWLDSLSRSINVSHINSEVLNKMREIDPAILLISCFCNGRVGGYRNAVRFKLGYDKYNIIIHAIKDCLASDKIIHKLCDCNTISSIVYRLSRFRCTGHDDQELAEIIFDFCKKAAESLNLDLHDLLEIVFPSMKDLEISDTLILRLIQLCGEDHCFSKQPILKFLHSNKRISKEKKFMMKIFDFEPAAK